MELVELWRAAGEVSLGTLLDFLITDQVLSDIRSWWECDPESNWDPEEDLRRYAEYKRAARRERPAQLPQYFIAESERVSSDTAGTWTGWSDKTAVLVDWS